MTFLLKVTGIIILFCIGSLCGCQDKTKAYTGEDQDTTQVFNTDTLTTAVYNADSLVRLPPPPQK